MRPVLSVITLLLILCTACGGQSGKELDSPPPELFYMFAGCDDTFGVKEVSADAAGGEVAVPTQQTFGGKNISVNDIITGAELVWVESPRVTMEIKGDADYDISRCVAGETVPSPNGFEWCNPQGRDLWVHQWVAVSQDGSNVYLYLQPNEGTEPRTAFVAPRQYLLYGLIKVTQEAKPAM